MPCLRASGNTLRFEAAKRRIQAVERHLYRVEGKVVRQHAPVNAGIFVSGESDRPHFPLLLSLQQRLSRAARGEDQVRISFVNHFVDLPDVQVIGLQSPQRFFQLLHGHIFAASVSADFGHDHGLVALPFQRGAQHFFAVTVVIVPGIVEEVDARIHRHARRFRWLLSGPWPSPGGSRPDPSPKPGCRCVPAVDAESTRRSPPIAAAVSAVLVP